MRRLNQYSNIEWLKLAPLKHALKEWRNKLIIRTYNLLKPRRYEDYIRQVEALRDGNVMLVIAFEQPLVIDWLLTLAKKNIADAQVLIFDNSRKASLRKEIKAVCDKHHAMYLGLPRNPTTHVNRSHAMAMNWVYYNVVRKIRPKRFGFIDHDLIPVSPVRVFDNLELQPAYGARRPYFNKIDGNVWSLWAGYCFFDYDYTKNLGLDFLYDFSLGLDTGGQNYHVLYKYLKRSKIRFASDVNVSSKVAILSGRLLNVIDGAWYHIGGVGYLDNFEQKSAAAIELLDALQSGKPWSEITVPHEEKSVFSVDDPCDAVRSI